ncbi:MAG: type I restriction enzyme HsdR N-terminal domain-containing protein [Flavobacteriaceae bacterium]|nr:type I restriction enzyme HsdR N-terminal domain-containing protein [Flavobacteriaceae bacterium]
MQKLNFPKYNFRFKNNENKTLIFDIIRKKFVILTPEEWVRQHTLHFLITEKKYPVSYINVEKQLLINDSVKRYDIVTFKNDGDVEIIIECKAPSIPINQVTFDQIARYNLALNSNLLMVTNGLTHYFCKMDIKNKRYLFLRDLPKYNQLK